MKQKTLSLSLAFFSLFFLSACGRQQKPTTPDQIPEIEEAETNDDGSFSGSIKDLLGLGKNLKCTWAFETDQTQMSGTVYVSGQRSRTDMLVNGPQNNNLTVHSIVDGQTVYSWTDGQVQGFKFDIPPENNSSPNPTSENQQYQDWLKEYEYHCSSWSADNSLFQAPDGIKFVDLDQQMQDLKDKLGGVCDQLPSPQKEECLDNLQ